MSKIHKVTIIAVFGNLIAGFLNYYFHFVSGKILPLSTFGQLESLISLFTIISIASGAIGPVVINQINGHPASQTGSIIFFFQKKILNLSLFSALFLVILFPVINYFLKLNQNYLIYGIFVLQVIASAFFVFYQSVLQSQLRIILLLFLGTALSLTKVIFLILFRGFVNVSYISNVSLSCAYIFITIFTAIFINRHYVKSHNNSYSGQHQNLLSFSILSLLTNLFITVIASQDTLIARYFLSGPDSGSYAVDSLIGKIIFFFSSAILIVYYPLFCQNQNRSRLKSIFFSGLSFVVITGVLSIIAFNIFPAYILHLFFGTKYDSVTVLMPPISIYMSLFSVFYFLVQFLLSQQKKTASVVPLLTIIIQLGLIWYFHSTPAQIIRSLTLPLIPSSIVLVLLASYIVGVEPKPLLPVDNQVLN